jgi:hypothetical protein
VNAAKPKEHSPCLQPASAPRIGLPKNVYKHWLKQRPYLQKRFPRGIFSEIQAEAFFERFQNSKEGSELGKRAEP